jgi:hypothetical protein
VPTAKALRRRDADIQREEEEEEKQSTAEDAEIAEKKREAEVSSGLAASLPLRLCVSVSPAVASDS